MANGWGGARTPGSPAMVSGPGAHSARTDGGVMNPNSPSYGEGAALESLAASAPLAGSAGAPPTGGAAGPDMSSLVGLSAAGDPSVPVTSGAAAGAGPGPEALGLPMDASAEKRADARSLSPALLNAMLAEASRPDATPSFKRRVREVVANL